VREDMQLGVAPRDKTAVKPDEAVAIVEGDQVTSHGKFPPEPEFCETL
jgi:hypothetical protein